MIFVDSRQWSSIFCCHDAYVVVLASYLVFGFDSYCLYSLYYTVNTSRLNWNSSDLS